MKCWENLQEDSWLSGKNPGKWMIVGETVDKQSFRGLECKDDWGLDVHDSLLREMRKTFPPEIVQKAINASSNKNISDPCIYFPLAFDMFQGYYHHSAVLQVRLNLLHTDPGPEQRVFTLLFHEGQRLLGDLDIAAGQRSFWNITRLFDGEDFDVKLTGELRVAFGMDGGKEISKLRGLNLKNYYELAQYSGGGMYSVCINTPTLSQIFLLHGIHEAIVSSTGEGNHAF